LIEEKFKRNYDEEPQVDPNAEISPEQLAEEKALKRQIKKEQFTMETCQNGYKDLLEINKYAQNCPSNCQMKLLVPERLSYKGPDPPPADWMLEEEPQAPVDAPPAKAGAKGKQVEVAPVVEV
jgi:hypothetical protein